MIDVTSLQHKSKELRRKVLDIAYKTGRGHIGSAFSVMEILTTMYYTDLYEPNTDFLLMGKGHACLPVYCILNELGFITNELLATFGTSGGKLGIQFDRSIPTMEYNTGSLGNVFGIGLGLSVSKKYRRVYAIVGDGECEEGSIWETALFAGRGSKIPMILIVDKNQLGVVEEIHDDTLKQRFESFGLLTIEINGHDHTEIYNVLQQGLVLNQPLVVVANTVKGKGVSFMENVALWHAGAMTEEQYLQAKKELQND